MVRVPTVVDLFSTASNEAPQYSVSNPSVTSPFDESVETSLQYLHFSRSSQEVAAQAIKTNAAANRIFLFIKVLFQFKIIKLLINRAESLKKGCIYSDLLITDASIQ